MHENLLQRITILTGLAFATGCANDEVLPPPPLAEALPATPTTPDPPVVPNIAKAERDSAALCLSPIDAAAMQLAHPTGACPTELNVKQAKPLATNWKRRTGGPWIERLVLIDTGADSECCYAQSFARVPGSPPSKGRPMIVNGEVQLPSLTWLKAPTTEHAAAQAWRMDARMEASSVAAFERAAAELSAAGAPQSLVDRCLTAAQDETRHAYTCLRIAEQLDGGRAQLGAQAPWECRKLDVVELAITTLTEGAMPETMAAAEARLAAQQCDNPSIRNELLTIADDEQAHADLGWAIIGWAAEIEEQKVQAALAKTLARKPWPLGDEARDDSAGRLGHQARSALQQSLFVEVFWPLRDRISA